MYRVCLRRVAARARLAPRSGARRVLLLWECQRHCCWPAGLHAALARQTRIVVPVVVAVVVVVAAVAAAAAVVVVAAVAAVVVVVVVVVVIVAVVVVVGASKQASKPVSS